MHRETCTVLMGCSKGSVVRLAPSSLLCAQTGRACPGLCAWAGGWARGPVDDGVRLSLALEVRDCARGPVDDGVRGAGAVRAGPFAGGLNPLMRSWALLVAVWAACLDYHQWG